MENSSLENKNPKETIVKAKFFIPSLGKSKYLRLKIAPSHIENAGLGVFAVDTIPYGAMGIYKGKRISPKKESKINEYYTWDIHPFDKFTGLKTTDDKILFYLDAYDTKYSNWTRYVNCGIKDKFNNLYPIEHFGKMNYIAERDIKPGEELFIDYGEEYRQHHLGLEGEYY